MKGAYRHLWILVVAALASGAWAGEQTEPSEGGQADQSEWLASIEDLVFHPAEMEILRGPNVSRELATLKMKDTTAPTDYAPTSASYKSFVKSDVPECKLVHGGLKIGAEYYTDRTYKLLEVPDKLQGLTLLQTKNGHKSIVDARYAIVARSRGPFYCFVALDERSIKTHQDDGMPSWLEEFSLTQHRIASTDGVMRRSGSEFLVLVKYVSGGRVALGPHAGHPTLNSMYFAFFGVAEESSP